MAAPMVKPVFCTSRSILQGLCGFCSRHAIASRSENVLSKYKTSALQLSKYMSTNRLLKQYSKGDDAESLEEFAADLDVKEKPKKYKAWTPADDVYMIKDYPPKETTFKDAMKRLRTQASWSYVPDREYKDRHIDVTLYLDLNVGEKKLPAFSNLWTPPHHFWKTNKVICIAEGDGAKLAEEAGADLVVGQEQFPEIIEGEITISDFDYCVADQNMVRHLAALKKYLREKFPTAKKGSAGKDVGPLVTKFKHVKKYRVLEKFDRISNCIIGNLGLSDEQIEDNLKFLITDVCTHKPLSAGPLITKLAICGYRLDSYKINLNDYIQQEEQKETIVDTRSELEKIEDELRQLRAS
ncbi:putative 39S ribosomal protein L1, mitochondrial [Apostichopus japonicus]|uniref:Putative 39S ribosomal protein L1, mitochondrial n=1 Tax=Stichopus japonicus TaxID=307972 RepID=A0A2G8JPS7_STIJA|nr:putative 39S ribosomal protein L1, mitochondrial [Apostichopus japonicus]